MYLLKVVTIVVLFPYLQTILTLFACDDDVVMFTFDCGVVYAYRSVIRCVALCCLTLVG